MSRNQQDNMIFKLRREMHFSNGRNDGFIFATNCQANPEIIRQEIENIQQRIAEQLTDTSTRSMDEGSSPRIYLDGFISALNDALEIISDSTKGDEL